MSTMKNKIIHFAKNNKAVVAIEFAIIAFPFFMLLMAIIEVGLTTFFDSTLNTALRAAARQGIAQGYDSEAQIIQIMQDKSGGIFNSGSATFAYVTYSDLNNAQLATYAQDPTTLFVPSNNFASTMANKDAQQNGKIVIYALKYKWGGFTQIFSHIGAGFELVPQNIYAITVVRNEAFN